MNISRVVQKTPRLGILRISAVISLSALLLIFPALLRGQGGARDALASFPADTQQMVYTNLAQLRTSVDYPQIRQWIFTKQLRDFENFLVSIGTDPEKDVSEVSLGWRGEDVGKSSFFGLAEGQFQPEQTREYVIQHQLPYQRRAGYDFYALGSGDDRDNLFFIFFDTSSGAFGRLDDLMAMLEVRRGTHPSLNSNSEFASAEGELEGSAPQWGVARGAAAANQAAPWLSGGAKLSADFKNFLAPIGLVLYRIDWTSGFSTQVTIVCEKPEQATSLAQILTVLRAIRPTTAVSAAPGVASLFQEMAIQANGSRVEITGSVSMDRAERIFRTANAKASP